MKDFQNEWAILHGDIEKYERFSLVIKLFSVLVSVLCIVHHVDMRFAVAILLVLWLQDGIWKTFQKRMQTRILFLEEKLTNEVEGNNLAFQFYTQWENKRQGVVGLIKEYLLNSAKPTVVYPYAVLILFMLYFYP